MGRQYLAAMARACVTGIPLPAHAQGGGGDKVVPSEFVSILSELTDRAPFHPFCARARRRIHTGERRR